MKSKLLAMALGIAAMFSGCQSEDQGFSSSQSEKTTFSVVVNDGTATRVTVPDVAPTRYIMEMYELEREGDSVSGTPQRLVQSAGSFEVVLKEGGYYACLFWADYGTAHENTGDYDAEDLTRVSTRVNPTNAAFGGSVRFTYDSQALTKPYLSPVLTHVVAQVNFKQTEDFTAENNTLKVEYPRTFSINIDGNAITEIGMRATHTFMGIAKASKDKTVGTSYIIVADATQTVMDIKATFNEEVVKDISNVPFQRNYRTNISGAYSNLYGSTLSFVCDEEWEIPESDAIFDPKIYNDHTTAVVPRGDGTEVVPYLIESASNLCWLKANLKGYHHFKMMTDIEIASSTWTPISSTYNLFEGFFDGNGYRFTGKMIAAENAEQWCFGVFGKLDKGSIIKNLTNEAEVIAPHVSNVGGIAGSSYGLLLNCKNSGTITGISNVGGIVGQGIYVDPMMTSGEKLVISGCENSGEIIALASEDYTGSLEGNIGGIVGCIYFEPSKEVTDADAVSLIIENCKNTGNVSSPGIYVGGIVGVPMILRSTCKVISGTNSGTIKSGDIVATDDIGGASKVGLLVGGRYMGYPSGNVVVL